MQDSFLGMKHK